MARCNLLLPSMGESVSEATIVNWLIQPGEVVNTDDTIVEIATDKVDSEVPSPVTGKLIEQRFQKDQVAQVGDILAVLEIEGEDTDLHNDEVVEETIKEEPGWTFRCDV